MAKMIIYQVKKIFGGKISIRSHVVRFAKRTRQPIVVKFNRQKMTIDYYSLGNYTTDNNEYTAKRTDQYASIGEKYKLYDYIWRPDSEHIGWTQEGLYKVSEIW